MPKMTLDQANTICRVALEKAREIDCKPLAVAVLDDGGHLKAFQREDNTSIMRFEIANGKAYGSLGMGMASRALAGVAAERPAFIQALTAASGGRVIPVPGGVLIRESGGTVLGAVGISGDTSDVDEECAVAGIAAAGLTADTGN